MKKTLSILFIFIVFTNVYSKWTFVSTTSGSAINSISVVNQNLIWLCTDANQVYKSTNGGTAWLLRNGGLPAGNLYGISALDTTTCWVGTVAGSIYKTTNGGINWTLQFSLAGSFTNGIKMFDASYGFYYGDPTGAGQPYQLRYTTNGGTNWLLSPGAPIAGNEFGVINAWDWTDTGKIWVGSANLTASAPNANVYRTTNGFRGGGWLASSVSGTGGAAGLYYQAVAFINASSGMIGSNGSNIRRSTDGGATWSVVTNPTGLTTFAAINMHGLKDGSNIVRICVNISATQYNAYRTDNLGVSWVQETLPAQGTINGLQHMQFYDASLGYSGGNAGTFMKYTNITLNINSIVEGFYDAASNNMRIKDTVRAYLRNITSPFAAVDSAKAKVDSVTMLGRYMFDNASAGTYYLQMKGRNWIETWNAAGVAYTPGTISSYNFTTASTQAFGSNMPQVDASPLRFAFYSGDPNQDGTVDVSDLITVYNDVSNFVSGYVPSDINGDDFTDVSDLIITYNNSVNFVGVIRP